MNETPARTLTATREDILVTGLAALAITIHIAEASLPSLFPGVKPGLANIITIVTYIIFGWRYAAWVVFLRVLVGSLLLGTFLSPTFILSFSGACATLLILWLVNLSPKRLLSALGLSILMAIAHISAQFWVAYVLFIPNQALLHLYPVLLTAAFFMGTLSGIIAIRLLKAGREKINSRLKSLA